MADSDGVASLGDDYNSLFIFPWSEIGQFDREFFIGPALGLGKSGSFVLVGEHIISVMENFDNLWKMELDQKQGREIEAERNFSFASLHSKHFQSFKVRVDEKGT